MKALSLWQPWASLIRIGIKRTETRHWSTTYRGPLAIHAAQRWGKDQREAAARFAGTHPELTEFPRGGVIAVVDLVDVYEFTACLPEYVTDADYDAGDFDPGRFGWKLENVRVVNAPYIRGRQSLWTLTGEDLAKVTAALEAAA